jgi:hypothetical protein
MDGITRRTQLLVVTAIALSAGACDQTTGPNALDDAIVLDLAVLAADATLEEVAMWGQPLGFGPAAVAGFAPGRPGGKQGFAGDPSGTRTATFRDADGAEQDGFDQLTTASIHIVHDVAGEITRGNFSATIVRARDMTATGLEGEETHRTWNGSGSSEMSRGGVREDGTERAHSSSGSFEYEDVVVTIPGSDPRYPVSGTIRRSMSGVRTTAAGSETREVEVVITFDGTATATATINGEAMEIDLSTRDGRNPLRRSPRGAGTAG